MKFLFTTNPLLGHLLPMVPPGVARARQLMPMAAAWRPDVVVHEQPTCRSSPSSSVPSPPSSSARPTRARALFTAPYLDHPGRHPPGAEQHQLRPGCMRPPG